MCLFNLIITKNCLIIYFANSLFYFVKLLAIWVLIRFPVFPFQHAIRLVVVTNIHV